MPGIVLTQYTIYVNPADQPGKFVVREWHVVRGSPEPVAGESWVVESLDAARAVVPDGCFRLERAPDDDPVILETWT